MNRSSQATGTLYVVATPIGNLGDLSHRAEEILARVHRIACEDTRHTRKLLNHLGLSTPLVSYYREKEWERTGQLLQLLQEGHDLALVSDAGTPGISDPGAILVAAAHAANIAVVPIPGACALATALSIAGLTESPFFFAGFPPAKSQSRRSLLQSLATLPYPLVFYEAPHRIHATLQDLLDVLGNRPCQLFRELTKRYEQRLAGTAEELAEALAHGVKGELVLIVDGAPEPEPARPEDVDDLLRWYRDTKHSSLKGAVQAIANDLQLRRSEVYQRALDIWREQE